MNTVVGSGFLVIDVSFKDQVLKELEARGVELHGVKDEKVVFLAEGRNAAELKARMDGLQAIEGVLGVYLTYFSLPQTGDE